MCGIAGYSLNHGATAHPQWCESLSSLLSHRGPDDSGFIYDDDNNAFLYHSRLSIIDPSVNGHQPMSSSCGKVSLVFNGEIYNYRELRARLIKSGYFFRGDSDTEVLLALYIHITSIAGGITRDNLVQHFFQVINGIFSFAILDRERRFVLIARDSYGVKPLYLNPDHTGIYFASELKALPRLKMSLSAPSIDRYLTYLYSPGQHTPATQIFKLGPGEAAILSDGSLAERFHWFQLPIFLRPPLHQPTLSKHQSVSGVQTLLKQAVSRQLVSDVPVGAFLSGGLDSSSLVALARESCPDIQCFTINSDSSSGEGFSDDLPYAQHVARHLRVPLHVASVDSALLASSIADMVWHLDEPLADPAALNVLFISRLARKFGIKVLLSGAGGDDLFSGYRRHLALRSERFWAWMPHRTRIHLLQLTSQLPVSHPFFRRIRKAFSGAHLEGDLRLVNYFRWADRSDLLALYTPDFRAALAQEQADDPMLVFLAGLPTDTPPLERMLALEQRFFLTDHNLTYTDKMSMAAGVEVRVPFLDHDLVNFAAGIPPQYKLFRGQTKWVLKKAMEPYLPRNVIYRPKSGFGSPVRRWLRQELRDWLADTLSPDCLKKRGLFDPQAVHRLIASNDQGKVDATYTLLSLACIEIWCKFFIDDNQTPPVNS